MRCKTCGRTIEDNSIYCNWCGARQLRKKRSIPEAKQLPSGNWRIRLQDIGMSATFPTKREAELWALEMRERKTAPAEKMTLNEAFDRFLADKEAVLSPSTYRGYIAMQRSAFNDIISKPLNSINFQQFINSQTKKYSPKTVKNQWGFIAAAMRYIEVSAPTVKLPTVVKKEREWLDFEQIKQYLKAIENESEELRMIVMLGLHSLRRSEIYALTPKHIDLEKGIISVSGAAVLNADNELVIKAANKTSASVRQIPIMIPQLIPLLRHRINDCGAGDRIIASPINSSYKQIMRVAEGVGLPPITPHSLRHSFCALCFHLGWSERATMKAGGWSEARTVHSIYEHLSALDYEDEIDKMKAFYAKSHEEDT